MSARDEISPGDPVDAANGVGPARSEDLEAAGHDTIEDLQIASTDELASVVPRRIAEQIKSHVGDKIENVPNAAVAKEKAQQIPGAKSKLVRTPDGKQQAKVLRKQDEQHKPGATIEIHKG